MQSTDNEIIGAVKIKDGLFIGDEYAAQDLEFIVTNKVTYVVNCAGKQIPNHFESIGVSYLALNWMETDYQILFDIKDEVINEIFKFIDGALSKGESILVHSVKGQNRSCCVLAAYFMRKYRWTLYKTLEFLHSRKSNLEIRSNFFTQLMNLENRLQKIGYGAKTYNWNEIGDDPKNVESEELLLTNTFLNSKKLPVNDTSNSGNKVKDSKGKINWSDNLENTNNNRGILTSSDGFNIAKKDKPQSNQNKNKLYVKSILKGSNKLFSIKNGEVISPNQLAANQSNQQPIINKTIPKSPSVAGSLKDQINLARPSSASGGGGSSSSGGNMLKSNSVSTLDKAQGINPKEPNVQGNIIHITVNNFITNNNVPENPNEQKMKLGLIDHNSGNIKQPVSSSSATSLQSLKPGLSEFNLNKDLANFPSSAKSYSSTRIPQTNEQEILDKEKSKRGYSPSMISMMNPNSSSSDRQRNGYSSVDDKLEMKTLKKSTNDGQQVFSGLLKSKLGSNSAKELSTFQGNMKSNSSSSSSSLSSAQMPGYSGFLGMPNSYLNDKKLMGKPIGYNQSNEKDNMIGNPNNDLNSLAKYGQTSENSNLAIGKNNSALYKYLTGGKGPIRATNLIGQKQPSTIEQDLKITDYNLTSYYTKNNNTSQQPSRDNKQPMNLTRPSTAPENNRNQDNKSNNLSKKSSQESPYNSSSRNAFGRTNKNLEDSGAFGHQRLGSAQPSKDNTKSNDKDSRSRLRSSSPGNPPSTLSALGFIQDFSKPKWKF